MLDANKARDKLEDILNKKEYQVYNNHSKGFLEILWEKAKAWLTEQFEKLIPSSDSASRLSGPILIAIIVFVIICLAFVAFILIRNSKRNRMLRDQKPLKSMQEMNWSFQQHLNEGSRQEEIENYTSATRHLFLALLLYFHDKKWLEARMWKTNWDYYEELRKVNNQSADRFYKLSSFFDEVTYGEQIVQKDAFLSFKNGVMIWFKEDEQPVERSLKTL